jgi:hypothetical protein
MEEQITVKTGFDLKEFKFFYRQLVLACFFFHACGLLNSPTARLINFHTYEKKLHF